MQRLSGSVYMIRFEKPVYSIGLYLTFFVAYIVVGYLLFNYSFQSIIVPIWMPAGIALVGCYIWWWRFVPAVFIAAFIFNYLILDIDDSKGLLINQTLSIYLISMGATLQAVVGSALLRYWLGHPLKQTSHLKNFYFIVFIGIIVNLISASIGSFSLSVFSAAYDIGHYWTNFFYWWLGDSLGTLLIAPLLFSFIGLASSGVEIRRSRLLFLSTSGLLFIAVLLITGIFINITNKNITETTQREITSIEKGFYGELNNSTVQLHNLASYIQRTEDVTRNNFNEIVHELTHKYPTIAAMSWNPVITQKDKIQHQRELNDIYGKEVIIKGNALSANDPIVYVRFISPEENNEKAIGFNVYSNVDRKNTLNKASSSFQAQVTPIISLVQSTVRKPAYLMFFPIYNSEKLLRGFVTGVFLVEDMIVNALGLEDYDRYNYELYEAGKDHWFSSNIGSDTSGSDNKSFSHDAANNRSVNSLKTNESAEKIEFNFSGKKWDLYLHVNKQYLLQQQNQSYLLLYFVEIITVSFIMLFILMMNSRQLDLNKQVAEKTKSLKLAMHEANLANSAKSRFLANMSHEIRTPMNAVIGFSQLARDSNDFETIKYYLENIEISSDLLLNIVNDILDISKVEADKLLLSHENFDIHQSLHRLSSVFLIQAEAKGLEWKLISDIPHDLYFKGDQTRFEQVVVNLCSNAIKFTKNGFVHVTAETNKINASKYQVTIKVQDSGIGISDKVKQKLFSAFTQADENTSREFGGTGLGLALSKELSRLMGGGITIGDNEGGGSEFIFTCYIACADEGYEPPAKALSTLDSKDIKQPRVASNISKANHNNVKDQINTPPESKTDNHPLLSVQGMHLLVAEDNEINQLVIGAILTNLGITADIVVNGEEAIEKVQQNSYDAILMDCQMPVMDGYTATAAIRKLAGFEHIPIFALTADATKESKIRAQEVGFSCHLSKPIRVENLVSALNKI